MVGSPDVRPYVNLTLFDLTPQDLYDNAVQTLLTNLPGWVAREGNIEVLLLENQALMLSEGIFAINRLPSAITEIMARLFGITRDPGAAPTCTLEFTMVGTAGYTIPAGTQVRLDLMTSDAAIVFTTDVDLVIAPASSTGQVTATGGTFTDIANGINNQLVPLIDALLYVNQVEIVTAVTGGRVAETDQDYFTRAASKFSRLNDTLVLPSDFQARSTDDPSIYARASVYDNWSPNTIPTPVITDVTNATTGGTLGDGTYSYRITAINAQGQTLASAADSVVVTSGTGTNKTTITWTAPTVSPEVSPITGYKIYGRSAGTELLLATVGLVLTWADDGSLTPAGALPTANTTGWGVGDVPGHVTVAVYGPAGLVSAGNKTALNTALQEQAASMLNVHVIDPTITTIAVTATIVIASGYLAADVITAVETRLEEYLNPSTWEWGDTVYRNELISVIDQVTGVQRVATLTVPAADTVLSAVANLVDAGTLTITEA